MSVNYGLHLFTSAHLKVECILSIPATSSASSVAVSRSTSTQHLIDSFAQTDTSGICTSASQDMTDSINTRDRTISVTEEDEEQVSLTDRYRCVSLSEEDERTLEGSAIATATNLPGSQVSFK